MNRFRRLIGLSIFKKLLEDNAKGAGYPFEWSWLIDERYRDILELVVLFEFDGKNTSDDIANIFGMPVAWGKDLLFSIELVKLPPSNEQVARIGVSHEMFHASVFEGLKAAIRYLLVTESERTINEWWKSDNE